MYALGTYRRWGWGAYENCDPRDTACVQRNTSLEVSGQQQNAIDQTNAARDLCHRNADLSSEPFRSQLNAQCDANYPAGAATGGESIQYWSSTATDDAKANAFDTAAQQAADYNAQQAFKAAELLAELKHAGQTFIPAGLPQPAPSPVTSTIIPKPATTPAPGVTPQLWSLDTSVPSAGGFTLPAASSIPWWGWLLGIGAVGLALKGGR